MDVFVSYASQDRARAASFADVLSEKLGLSVFFDRSYIPVGSKWQNVLDEKLNEAKAIVVLWSKYSVKSKWVRYEAKIGLERDVLLPIIIQKEGLLIPNDFCHIHTADLSVCDFTFEHDEFENFIHSLGKLISKPNIQYNETEKSGPESVKEITLVPKEWLNYNNTKILLMFIHQGVIMPWMVAEILRISENEAIRYLQILERNGYVERFGGLLNYIKSLGNETDESNDQVVDPSDIQYVLSPKGKELTRKANQTYTIG